MGSRAALVAAFTTILVWSSSYPVARVGLRHFDPVEFSALRILTAAAALVLVAGPLRVGFPARGDRLQVFGAGVIGMTLYLSLLNTGLEVVESASTAILIAVAPIIVAVLSIRFIGERLTLWGWIGLGAASAGVLLVALGQGSGVRFGSSGLLVLLAAIAHAAYIVMTKPLMSRYRPVQVATWAIWSAALAFIPLLARVPSQLAAAPLEGRLAFLYLGVGSSAICFVLWGRALVDAPASVVASTIYAAPPLSALIGWVWLGEKPSLWVLLGGVFILSAVGLVIRKGVEVVDHPTGEGRLRLRARS